MEYFPSKKAKFLLLAWAGMSALISQLFSQNFRTVDASWIQQLRASSSDSIYIVNFWATWCKPCVEELPEFEQIRKSYTNQKVKVVLMSNDMRKATAKILPEFIHEHQLQVPVYWMNETNANSWLNRVDSTWSGAIPATWIYQPQKKRHFFREGEITIEMIKQITDSFVLTP